VYNPADDSLPPPQTRLEAEFKERLANDFGIRFNSLLTITNMPIKRFAEQLARSGRLEAYMALLVRHFNPATIDDLMCRDLVSVGWEGTLYDCDFNQMLESPILGGATALTIFDIDNLDEIADVAIRTGPHCFGCTAGAGSGCNGAIKD
jgi:radical SAM/Cys-rich protein